MADARSQQTTGNDIARTLGDIENEVIISWMLADADKMHANVKSLPADTGDTHTAKFRQLANAMKEVRRLCDALVTDKTPSVATAQTFATIASASASDTNAPAPA
jgi:hypothetical protein